MTALSRIDLIRYGILAMPLAFGGIPLYLYAPDFYATEVGLSLSLLASVLLTLRLFDAISDPLWGWISDRFASHRTLILNAAFAAYLVGFVALFNPGLNPVLNSVPSAAVVWFSVAILLATSGYSILVIQINSLGASWSACELNLVRINGHREAFGLVGLIIASIAPALLLNSFSKSAAFSLLAALLVLFLVFSYLLFLQWLRKLEIEQDEGAFNGKALDGTAIDGAKNGARITAYVNFPKKLLLDAKGFFAIYAISAFASACPAVLIVFFVRDYLNLEAWTGLFLILYFLSGIAFMPVWKLIANAKGSAFAWAVSMLLAILSFSTVLLLGEDSFWGFALVCLASGIAFGAELTIPPTILAKYLHRRSSIANAGVAYSVIAFLSKLALALSAGLMFWILDLYGFEPNQQNTEPATNSLLYCYGLLPLLLKLMALLLLVIARGGNSDKKNSRNNILNMDRSYAS